MCLTEASGREPKGGAQDLLSRGLEGLGHLVQDVGRLVNPTPLLPRRRVDLPKRGLEAEGSVADGKLQGSREPPLLEIQEQLRPALLLPELRLQGAGVGTRGDALEVEPWDHSSMDRLFRR